MKNMNKLIKEKIASKTSRFIGEKVINSVGNSTNDCLLWIFDEPEMAEVLMKNHIDTKDKD